MSLISCPECLKDVSDKAKACPQCGAALQKSHGWAYVIYVPLALLGLFLMIGIFGGNDPETTAKQAARDAIALCWKDQTRKSLDPGTARFVASVCEFKEKEFRTKYGFAP